MKLRLMGNIKKIFTIIMLVMIAVTSTRKMFSQTDSEKRAMWIFNIASGTTWENGSTVPKYVIGVFSSETEYNEIKKIAEKRTVKGKAVEVYRYSKLEEINPNHIIYITKNENAHLELVCNKLKNKNVLIISDRSEQPEYSVFNLCKSNTSEPFNINTKLAKEQNLELSASIFKDRRKQSGYTEDAS
ncbi:MAG: YfiR family protein [Bacteroidales bacterium]|nr:YfiR family protein [Bacteroidales bacterium]